MLKENKHEVFENKIKSHKRLTYDILDGMIDWVRVIDKNDTIIYANKTMEEGLGESIVGKKCFSVLGKACHCERCITETTIATGMIAEKEEIIGNKIFSVKSSPVKGIDGEIYASVEVFRDVTKERKLEKEIMKKNQKMSKDLDFARTLQKKILPPQGNLGNVTIDYLYRPSEMLSGDMFDVFNVGENHIGIYISDVVGHGVAASMMTMFVRQTMRAIKEEKLMPSEALTELHKRFLDLNLDDDKYFTIFYGILDKRDNTFTYVNGGHNSIPLLVNEDGIRLLESKGYPICRIFDTVQYGENNIRLEEKDKIIFYSDGIIEAKNHKRVEFGLNRLIDAIKAGKDNIINNIENSIDRFRVNNQEDDFAILVMEVLK